MVLTTAEKISKGIIDLQRDQPFFSFLAMRLRVSEMPKDMPVLCRTAGVTADGRLLFAPEFIDKLSMPEIVGLLCHETLHVALIHFLRTGNRNRVVANLAQDCVVNMACINANLQLPKGGIPYSKYGDSCEVPLGFETYVVYSVSQKSWEQIYDELMQEYAKNNQQPPPDWSGFDVHLRDEGEQLSSAEQEVIVREWSGAVIEAATYSQKIGKLPKGMERFIEGLLKPRISWKEELLAYIKPMFSPVDFTYRKPNRKSIVLGVYMPDIQKEFLQVEVLVDTSGSINDQTLLEFLSEVVAIAESHQHVKVFVTFCDTVASDRYEVANGDIPKLFQTKCKGGGGTKLENGLSKIDKEGEDVSVVIVLTDGYNDFSYSKNPYPFEVVWVISPHGTKDIPYGKVISMELK